MSFILDEYNNKIYKILSSKVIAEQNFDVYEIEHKVTKAKILLFICDDENRVFNITFKTPVRNSKGIPHILEHSVLCGSRKYNVKDPFIELAKSSLNTFLNACTFPDKTCYPVASANLKDFHNLMDVYLDAVFFPNAVKDERIFRQEGWHYEIGEKGEVKPNGVVYNEMKGVYSDPDSLLEMAVLQNLFKGTNYEFESGGDPRVITDLSYEEFVEFHKKYYSPSNSITTFYGKLDFNQELKYLHDEYFSKFDYIDVNAKFIESQVVDTDNVLTTLYNSDTEDKEKSYIALTYNIGRDKSTLRYLILKMFDYVYFSSDSAYLKEKLQNEGFGEAVYTRVEFGLYEGFFSIVSQNINEDKLDDFIRIIKEAFNNILKDGIDIEKFKAAMNLMYFEAAESESGNTPRGLLCSFSMLDSYLYDKGYSAFIEYKEAFDVIKNINLNDKNNIIYKIIKDDLIDNEKRVINVLRPKKDYNVTAGKIFKLSDDEKKKVSDFCDELKKYQAMVDDEEKLSCVPKLTKSDIEREKNLLDYEVIDISGTKTIATFNNPKDIVYISLLFDTSKVSDAEICLLTLISDTMQKLDLKDININEFNNFVDSNTGGLDIRQNMFNDGSLFQFDIKVIKDKIDMAFKVFETIFTHYLFNDTKKIGIILNEAKISSKISMMSSGHISSMQRAQSDYIKSARLGDLTSGSGVGYNKFISAVSSDYEKNADLYNETIALLFEKLIRLDMTLAVCINKKYYDDFFNKFTQFKKKFSEYISTSSFDNDKYENNLATIIKNIDFQSFYKKVKKEAIVTTNDINFCSISSRFDPKLFSGQVFLLRTLFNYEYLWTNIRVLGGAYGCSSNFIKRGIYSFSSYRDPNLSKTNEVFLSVYDYLKNNKITQETIDKYIIGTIGSYDNLFSIVSRHRRNIASYYNEYDNETMNKERRQVLDMTEEDIKKLAEIFANHDDMSMCAIISKDKEAEAKKHYDEVWKI